MQEYWNWGIFFEPAPFGGVLYIHWLWDGFVTTVALSACAWVIAFIFGSIFGILRTVPNGFLKALGTAYVALFRNVPLLVQFFIWYLVIPELFPHSFSVWFKSEIDPNIQFFILSVLCLGSFTGARVCEQVRSGIMALSGSQKAAGLALGLTLPQTYIHVVMPNAYRTILPPMTSEMLNMVKNSAVASTIGLIELSAQANKLLEFSGHAYESFIAVTLAYIFLNYIVMKGMQFLEHRVKVPGNHGANHA